MVYAILMVFGVLCFSFCSRRSGYREGFRDGYAKALAECLRRMS